jgi:palmitoyltransferase
MTGGEAPRGGFSIATQSSCILQPEDENAPVDPRFHRVGSIRAIDNIYDLGFWRNLRDTMNWPVQ